MKFNLKDIALNIQKDKKKEEKTFIKQLKNIAHKIRKKFLNLKIFFKYEKGNILYYDEYSYENKKKVNTFALLSPIFLSFCNKIKHVVITLFNDACFFYIMKKKKKKSKNISKKLEKNKTILRNFDRCIFLNKTKDNISHKHIIEICKNYLINILHDIQNLEYESNNRNYMKDNKIKKTKRMFINKISNLNDFDSDNALYVSDESLIKKIMITNKYENHYFYNKKKIREKKKLYKINVYDEKSVKTYLIKNNISFKETVNQIYAFHKNKYQLIFHVIFSRFKNIFFLIFLILCLLQQIRIIRTSNYVYFVISFYFLFIFCILKDIHLIIQKIKNENNINNKNYKRVTHVGLVEVKYSNIKVGDIIYLEENEESPVDLILLKSCDNEKNIFISSKNFDGNTDLKLKKCLKITRNLPNIYDIFRLKIKIIIEKPHIYSNKMNGLFILLNYCEFVQNIYNDLILLQNIFYKNVNNEENYYNEIFNYLIEDTYIENSFNCLNFLLKKSIYLSEYDHKTKNSTSILSDTPCSGNLKNISKIKNNNNINSYNNHRNSSNSNFINEKNSSNSLKNNKDDNIEKNKYITPNNNIFLKKNVLINSSEKIRTEGYCDAFYTNIDNDNLCINKINKNYFSLKKKMRENSYIKYKENIKIENILWSNSKIIKGSIYGLVAYIGIDKKTNIVVSRKNNISLIENEIESKMKILLIIIVVFSSFLCLREKHILEKNTVVMFLNYFLLLFSFMPFINNFYIYLISKYYYFMLRKNKKVDKFTIFNYNIINEFSNTYFLLCDKTGTLTKNDLQLYKFHFLFDEFTVENSRLFFNIFLKIVDLNLIFNSCNKIKNHVILKNIEKFDIRNNINLYRKIFNKILNYTSEEINKIFLTFLCILFCNNTIITNKKKKDKCNTEKFCSFRSTSVEENVLIDFLKYNGMRILYKDNSKIVIGIYNSINTEKKRKKLEQDHGKITKTNHKYAECKKFVYENKVYNENILLSKTNIYYRNSLKKDHSFNKSNRTCNIRNIKHYKDGKYRIETCSSTSNDINYSKYKEKNFKSNIKRYNFEILEFLQFDSNNKIMCTLISYNNKIVNFIKGSDEYIINMLSIKENKKQIKKLCKFFSSNGFRVLIFAYKEISRSEYEDYKKSSNNLNKSDYFQNSFNKNINILAIITFKEEIQKNAKICLDMFRKANIKTWILSGDKKENIISISNSLNLVNKNNFFCYLNKKKLINLYKYKNKSISNISSKNYLLSECSSSNLYKNKFHDNLIKYSFYNNCNNYQIKKKKTLACSNSLKNTTLISLDISNSNNYNSTNKDYINSDNNNKKGIVYNTSQDDNVLKRELSYLYENRNKGKNITDTSSNTKEHVLDTNITHKFILNEDDISDILKTMLYDYDMKQTKNKNKNEKCIKDKYGYFNDIVYVINGDIIDYYLKYQQKEFMNVLKNSKCVLFYRCSSIQKGMIVRSLKKNTKYSVCSIGDDVNDLNMFIESDISISLYNSKNDICNLYADIKLSAFEDLATLFFLYGNRIYRNFNLITRYIYYRRITFFFLQFYFSYFFNCRFSIFSNILLLCYFILFAVITNISVLLSHSDLGDNVLKTNIIFYKFLKNDLFSLKIFYSILWVSLYQASLIFILSYYFFFGLNYEINTLTILFTTHLLQSLCLLNKCSLVVFIIHILFFVIYFILLIILNKFHFIYFFMNLKLLLNMLISNSIINFPYIIYYLYKKYKYKDSELNSMKYFQSFSSNCDQIFNIDTFSFDNIDFNIKKENIFNKYFKRILNN
ncbi:aminophospholipid transporter, putative [Plasmodium gallinaceum]|uniref:Aminophospholipid transporter, putative n=1 Tax=Plasmodium gallinaceum TaxID=5849 RepID=A0A1J1GQZ2_PLAGA|nr:aminophospholipid transporter, putative [Plasmodium gallinaceum]CRG94883.1 aminophospholipid transporter, putative [Plasmodium gallinaceum]